MASSLPTLTREQKVFFVGWGLIITILLTCIVWVIPASSKADDPLVEESVFDLLFLTVFLGILCVPMPNGGKVLRVVKRYAFLGITLVLGSYCFVWHMLSSGTWLPIYGHANMAAFFLPIVLGSLHIYKYINPSTE